MEIFLGAVAGTEVTGRGPRSGGFCRAGGRPCLSALEPCREIRLSYHPENTLAAALYAALGFRPAGEFEDEEAVAALSAEAAAA
ncbi:hypothetical protein [Streptomyces sp. JNUCC 63]